MEPVKEHSDSSSESSYASSESTVEIITERVQSSAMPSITPATPVDDQISPQRALALQRSADKDYHRLFLGPSTIANSRATNTIAAATEECRTSPLFSGPVLDHLADTTFSQYGLIGGEIPKAKEVDLLGGPVEPESPPEEKDERVFLNVSPPWSAFICGSQGSGKSHTLSCMLENCLLPTRLGKLQHPLTGIVFHYDKFTSYGGNQLCEAAYLCSSNIPVKVLVSPTNLWNMGKKYSNLPGVKGRCKLEVLPMRFRDVQLDVSRMMVLMAVSDKDGPMPLYIEVIMRILREMAITSKGRTGLDYQTFRKKLEVEGFSRDQNGPLKLRLELLESFMDKSLYSDKKALEEHNRAWSFDPGTLTIVDLSCPFVDENAACALFSICLELFLENRGKVGRVVALDEAHKFMTSSPSAINFTNTLLDIIRQQRHLATRVIIATQEPTVSPKLLDLASMTIVHRFTSPEWLHTLRGHLAGASGSAEETDKDGSGSAVSVGGKRDVARLFAEIVELNAGEALLFSPSAMLEWDDRQKGDEKNGVVQYGAGDLVGGMGSMALGGLESLVDGISEDKGGTKVVNGVKAGKKGKKKVGKKGVEEKGKPVKMGMRYVKMRVRERLTADGGKSVMAD